MASWGSLEELEAAAAAYQRYWWRSDEDAQETLRRRSTPARVRSRVLKQAGGVGIVTSADVYKWNATGLAHDEVYVAERQGLHGRIVAECLPRAAPPVAEPMVFFTIGCPGAGKTTVLRRVVEMWRAGAGRDHAYATVDADQVRQLLPEYASGLGALVVQAECFDVTYGPLLDAVVDRRGDVVFDTIGRLDSIRGSLQRFRDEGYRVHVLEARSDVSLCRERTERRAMTVDGRLVNPQMLVDAIEDAGAVIDALLGGGFPVAGWARIDTTAMSHPALIEGTAEWAEHVRHMPLSPES